MSDLRKHLQAARAAHNTARYEGDLAADVLTPRMTMGHQLMIGAAVASAIAAMITVVIWLGKASSSTSNPQITMNTRQTTDLPMVKKQESMLLPFTIERPSEAQFAASASDSISTTNASSTDTSMSASMPAVWGFPTVSSIQEELSTQSETQSNEESL